MKGLIDNNIKKNYAIVQIERIFDSNTGFLETISKKHSAKAVF